MGVGLILEKKLTMIGPATGPRIFQTAISTTKTKIMISAVLDKALTFFFRGKHHEVSPPFFPGISLKVIQII